MAITIVDGATCIWNYLKTHADLASFRAMIVSGADGVYEAGDLTSVILSREVEQRRSDVTPTKILAVSIQDASEKPSRRQEYLSEQVVHIRLLDRGKGYHNIRTARVELMERLKPNNFRVNVSDNQGIGILTIRWVGRSGHMRDRALALDYEVLTYALLVMREEN